MKREEKRSHLIDVATDLFKRLGYHAAGVDLVIAEAGIAKTTLYRHFGSKDGFIVAVLKRIDEKYREDMHDYVNGSAKLPAQKLLATFDFLEEWFEEASFYGCPFMSAASEYSDRDSPVFQEVVAHKNLVATHFETLARQAQLRKPKRVAEEINLLHEGATAVAHITGNAREARKAKSLAKLIIEAASPKGNGAG